MVGPSYKINYNQEERNLMAIPQTPEVQLPTKAGLEDQLTQLALQRAQLKDQVENIEKQLPVISSLIQLLGAQEAKAAEAAKVVPIKE